MKLFKALPSDTPDDVILNEAIPNISTLLGTTELAEHLGYAVRNQQNGSINAHININAKLFGGSFQLSELEASSLISNWYESALFDNLKDEELGMKFLKEVISEIVD